MVFFSTTGSIPGESPLDPVFGHTAEDIVNKEPVIDDSMSETYIRNCNALGQLVLPPPDITVFDPLFDGSRPESFINQSTKVEGETS